MSTKNEKDVSAAASEAARLLRAIPSEKREEASRINGKKGGRPLGWQKPLENIECNCDAKSDADHKATCLRGRAIRRRESVKKQA